MGSNVAQRRAAKAKRRKAVLAEKRKSEMLSTSLGERVRRAATLPIQHCLLTDGLFDIGIGTLILARGTTPDYLAMSTFLVDTCCLGIKDAFFQTVGGPTFEALVEGTEVGQLLVPIEPSYGRKLLRDLAVWAQSIGFAPVRDFSVVERLFGDVNVETCDATFRFGRDGEPFYVPGPTESDAQVRRRLEHLRARFGDEGFDVIEPSLVLRKA